MPKFIKGMNSVCRGIFIAVNIYTTKEERSQIENLTLQLKEVEEEKTKVKARKRKKTIMIRAENIKNRNILQRINLLKVDSLKRSKVLPIFKMTEEKKEKS